MSRNKIKAAIITGIIFLVCYFVIIRIYSIPVEEEFVLSIVMLLLFVSLLVIDSILAARKSKKQDKEDKT